MLAHLLVLLRYRRVPTSFYQNLSKKSQGSLFVSLFNFQGPLPLKERAFCILPHHRSFVNTFFSACPGFFPPHRFFLLTFLFKAALFLRSLHSLSVPLSKSAWSFYQTTPLLSISFSSFFSLSLHPSARCANNRDADLHAKGEERKNSYEENFDIPFVFKPLSRLSMKIKLNKRGALFFILIIVYPSIMSLI